MNDRQLNQLLQRAPAPERDESFWDGFPGTVMRSVARDRAQAAPARVPRLRWFVWSAGLATACLVAGFSIGLWRGRTTAPSAQQLAGMRHYFREFNSLFPNQIQTISFDENGPHLTLREAPALPGSIPVFVRICARNGCHSFITFSGERVRVNGETLEILTDAAGRVIVTGDNVLWTEGRFHPAKPPWKIQAQSLGEIL